MPSTRSTDDLHPPSIHVISHAAWALRARSILTEHHPLHRTPSRLTAARARKQCLHHQTKTPPKQPKFHQRKQNTPQKTPCSSKHAGHGGQARLGAEQGTNPTGTTLHANRNTPGPNTTTQDDTCTGGTQRGATRKRKQKTSPQHVRTNTTSLQGSTRTRRPHEPEEACARENATREAQHATQGQTRHTVTPTGPNMRAATSITNREASTNP